MRYLVYVRHTENLVTLIMLLEDELKANNLAAFLNSGQYFKEEVLVSSLSESEAENWKQKLKLPAKVMIGSAF